MKKHKCLENFGIRYSFYKRGRLGPTNFVIDFFLSFSVNNSLSANPKGLEDDLIFEEAKIFAVQKILINVLVKTAKYIA